MSDLKISIVQTRLHWEEVSKNLNHFDTLVKRIKRGSTDLIILPEMFSTGFSMRPYLFAEKPDGSAFKWMQKTAAEKNAVVCGSIMTTEKGKNYNRLIWMQPDGTFYKYDKRHLFRMGNEHQYYTGGTKKITVELKGWKILPLICYDLRFPVWSRQQNEKYDLLIYVANWPQRRAFAWQTLLMARAIENVSYVAAVNRIGIDGNGISHTGNSVVLDFTGKKLSKTKASKTSVETIKISKKDIDTFRQNFPALNDADKFKLI